MPGGVPGRGCCYKLIGALRAASSRSVVHCAPILCEKYIKNQTSYRYRYGTTFATPVTREVSSLNEVEGNFELLLLLLIPDCEWYGRAR